MISLKEILKANEELRTLEEKYNELARQNKELNAKLNIEEFEALSYEDAKETLSMLNISYRNEELKNTLKNIVSKKKNEKYPKLGDVHYYPVVDEISELTKEEKIYLDRQLRKYNSFGSISLYKLFKPSSTMSCSEEEEMHKRLSKILVDKKVLEEVHIIKCLCGSSCCDYEYVSTEKRNKFYAYHNFDEDNATDEEIDEHENNWHDGYIYIGCYNDGEYEITNIDEYEMAPKITQYKIIMEPDLALEEV